MVFHHRLLWLLIFLTFSTIVLGAATRVFDAGMACPDWPKCYGVWWPYGQGIDYVVDGVRYTLTQVLLEWGHRLNAAVVGFVLLGTLITAFWQKRWRLPLLAALVLLVQIKLGGITVWLYNVPWSVAIHLGNALIFFAVLLWWRRDVAARSQRQPLAAPHWPAYLFAALVWLTMLVGATVSSSHAGPACGELFLCFGKFFVSDPLQQIHMLHRLLAIAVLAGSILLLVMYKKTALRGSARGVHIIMWGQILLGILTLYSFGHYPEYYRLLSVLHLAWGTILWMAAIGTILRLYYGDAGRAH